MKPDRPAGEDPKPTRRPTRARRGPGGVIHSYQGYDPKRFPSPTQPPPNLASAAFEHMLRYGSTRDLTPEELANAVHLDPSQIAGLGPSLDALIEMLEERKAKILSTYETTNAIREAGEEVAQTAAERTPPDDLADAFNKALREEQIRDLERLWWRLDKRTDPFAPAILHVAESLGRKYEVEELASRYAFTGRDRMDVDTALEIKEELETIDRLLEQLREAMKNAQIAIIDMDELARFAEEADVENLRRLGEQIREHMEALAEQQGLERSADGFRLSPRAYRIFQSALLEEIFSDLDAARSGRHSGPISGEGAVELPKTRPYEFGDSAAHMDIPQSFTNAMLRAGREGAPADPVRMRPEDIEIHETRNNPRCATVVAMDMSGSMRYGGHYVHAKRMAIAFDGLIRSEYPGDYLGFVEMATFAKPKRIGEVPALMPKPVTIREPFVRLRADMSDPGISEMQIPPHFTNIQHALRLGRQMLAGQDTPNKQLVLLTDGLPTAHFEAETLYLLYPPDERTEEATMREGLLCAREGITINIFLLPSWSQSREDIAFAYALAESTRGRVFFTGGDDVDRFVLWDYVNMRRKVIG
jgi:uncharacterized protein with von Willebrand factor type A (vWA) domain